MGAGGPAMDYVTWPGSLAFAAGSSYTTRVRHHVTALPEGREVDGLQELWAEFEADLSAHAP